MVVQQSSQPSVSVNNVTSAGMDSSPPPHLFSFADYKNEEVGDVLAEAFKTGLVKREDLSITTKGWPPTNVVFWMGVFFNVAAMVTHIIRVFIPSVQHELKVVFIVLFASFFICYVLVYRRLTANPLIDGDNNDDQELHKGNGG